ISISKRNIAAITSLQRKLQGMKPYTQHKLKWAEANGAVPLAGLLLSHILLMIVYVHLLEKQKRFLEFQDLSEAAYPNLWAW
ncbi:MAG: hypothetical protein QXO75_06025, partial [Nitrososphaerota archaeon]